MMKRILLLAGLLLLFLPLLPAAYVRGILPVLLEFPLRTHHVTHPPYSPLIFTVFSLMALLLLSVLLFPKRFGFRNTETAGTSDHPGYFPMWGGAGILLCMAAWYIAWTRPAFLGGMNDFAFFPLWLGYILTVDAFVFKRSGSSIFSRTPKTFALLFPASALAWWYFEYLNRFVQNWWYAGVEDYTALHYALLSTVCFSTVFPAVFETKELLCTFHRFKAAYASGPKWFYPSRGVLFITLTLGIAALFVTGLYPSVFFFLTWFAPLVILGSTLALAGIDSPLTSMRRGDYTELISLAASALICGFFWEMWNYYSMPKWYYSIPYVMHFKLFEMPAPGYGGYLPFGPICWLMWLAMKCGHQQQASGRIR